MRALGVQLSKSVDGQQDVDIRYHVSSIEMQVARAHFLLGGYDRKSPICWVTPIRRGTSLIGVKRWLRALMVQTQLRSTGERAASMEWENMTFPRSSDNELQVCGADT